MKIKAAVTYEKGTPFEIKDVELADPKETEVLIKIVGCGICHNDLFMVDNAPMELPVALGHEGSGVVESVGSHVTSIKPGDHVVLCSYSCGKCEACLSGHPAQCIRCDEVDFGGVYADGTKRLKDENGVEISSFFSQSSFATYVIADERNTVVVDKDVDLAMLGPIGCGIQTGAGSVLNVLKPSPGNAFVVFGCGAVGLSAIMAAKLCNCSPIIGIDVIEDRLLLAKELGATHIINGKETESISNEILALTKGMGADFSFETTGVPLLINEALYGLKRGGKCGIVASTGGAEIGIKMQDALMGMSRSLIGIVQGDSIPWLFIPKLIELYKAGLFPYDKLIKYYDFEDINKAAEDAHSGAAIKPVLRMSE